MASIYQYERKTSVRKGRGGGDEQTGNGGEGTPPTAHPSSETRALQASDKQTMAWAKTYYAQMYHITKFDFQPTRSVYFRYATNRIFKNNGDLNS